MEEKRLKLSANEIEMLLEAMNRTNCYYGNRIERKQLLAKKMGTRRRPLEQNL